MVKDHKGNEYKNYMQMAKSWKLPYELVHQRYSIHKWPLVEALETPEEDGIAIMDHDGVIYDSFADMCDAWDISSATYRARRIRGWSKQDALTVAIVEPGSKEKDKERIMRILDKHEDITTDDLVEIVQLCIGIKEQNREVYSAKYENRPRKKTGPVPKTLKDRDGNEFIGLQEACDAYGQNHRLAKHRIFDGWPLQFALEYPSGGGVFKDHLGNEFSSYSALCKYYEIDKHEFAKRYDAGWALKDALMLPVKKEPIRTKEEKESLS